MIRLKISSKVLLLFLLVSLVPLFAVNLVLVDSAKSLLLNAAITRQQIVASDLADSVDNYLASKTSTLVFQSQILSARTFDETDASQDLAVLMKQDHNLEQVSLLNSSGFQQVVFDQQGQIHSLDDESSSDAFKAVSYLDGKDYVGSVSYNSKNDPQITIAVPLLRSNLNQNLDDLPAANFGTYSSPSDLQGVLVANYDISDLWQSVLSTKIGQGGYAYVVDGLGNLVAHPNKKFLSSHQNVSTVQAVSEFINGQTTTRQTTSEVGSQVISTPRELTRTNWAVIVEEPVSSIYSGIYSFLKFSAVIIVSAVVFAVLMSLLFRKQLLEPIRKLMSGVKKLEAGDFDHAINLNSKDELQELANTFNGMGLNIKRLIGDLRSKNLNLVVEQTKLNSILRSVSDGIIALNSSGQIISINPPAAKLIGKTPTDLQDKIMVDQYPWVHEGKQVVLELKKPGIYHLTDLSISHDNDVAYLDLMVTVIDRKDSEVAAIITIHDQTQAKELDIMKLDFVAIAAHELRTPVAVIQGYLSMLDKNAVNQMTIMNIENLHKAMIGTDQLRDLINKLLNISRIDRGDMDMHIEKLDLAHLVADNAKQHDAMAHTRGQHIVLKMNKDSHVYVPGDASSLTEVLNNLIGNALKYSGQGDNIRVNLIAKEDNVRVEVIDNGPGIPPAHRPKLFTKFYRVERSLVSGNRGTGLGLYLAKTIIDLHHGTIGIEPFTGNGSTFYFTLPIYNPEKHDKLVSKEKVSGGIHGWFKKRTSS